MWRRTHGHPGCMYGLRTLSGAVLSCSTTIFRSIIFTEVSSIKPEAWPTPPCKACLLNGLGQRNREQKHVPGPAARANVDNWAARRGSRSDGRCQRKETGCPPRAISVMHGGSWQISPAQVRTLDTLRTWWCPDSPARLTLCQPAVVKDVGRAESQRSEPFSLPNFRFVCRRAGGEWLHHLQRSFVLRGWGGPLEFFDFEYVVNGTQQLTRSTVRQTDGYLLECSVNRTHQLTRSPVNCRMFIWADGSTTPVLVTGCLWWVAG